MLIAAAMLLAALAIARFAPSDLRWLHMIKVLLNSLASFSCYWAWQHRREGAESGS